MRKNIIIQKGQIGLLTKKGDYQKVLEAGEYRFFDWTNQLAVTVVNLSDSRVE
ncbi:MAG: slipin family protein, partial [Hafnia sp.]